MADPEGDPGAQRVHLPVYGLARLPDYDHTTPAQQFAAEVRRLGGTVVLAHPGYYPASLPRLVPLVYGYERRNKNGFPFEPGGCPSPAF